MPQATDEHGQRDVRRRRVIRGRAPAGVEAPAGSRDERELLIVSNRLPVRRVRREGRSTWETSPGGLVSAVAPLARERQCAWVGWPGTAERVPEAFTHDRIELRAVRLRSAEVRAYYDGFCNRTLWPLYHDNVRTPEFRRPWWHTYVEVNRRFAEAVSELAVAGSCIWVHDYHLQLVPAMLRAQRPDLRIGFFLHIPFPPRELFAQLPWRRPLLEGLLGADLVGFQTVSGARNFAEVAKRFTSARGTVDRLTIDGRRVRVDGFPISIDAELFRRTAATDAVRRGVEAHRRRLGETRTILLGVDRLDYTKGIDVRLKAFRELLQQGRLSPDECVFVQVAVPSRERVDEYRAMRDHIERLVGEINGEFGDVGQVPVQYMHRSFDLEKLVALYAAADVMVVTPLRDGMNLVAKEYVMSRSDGSGVLVLSEFTGAARQLRAAVSVNPHDVDGLAGALERAVRMPRDEQRRRMSALQREVGRHDVRHWAGSFLGALGGEEAREEPAAVAAAR